MEVAESKAHRGIRPHDCRRSETSGDTPVGCFVCELSLLVDFASDSAAGSFRGAGSIEDAGPATYRFTLAGVSLEGVLALEGSAGRLRLASMCTTTFSSALSADVEGAVVIVDGDGTYTGISGTGRLAGSLTYDASRHGFALEAICRVLTQRRGA